MGFGPIFLFKEDKAKFHVGFYCYNSQRSWPLLARIIRFRTEQGSIGYIWHYSQEWFLPISVCSELCDFSLSHRAVSPCLTMNLAISNPQYRYRLILSSSNSEHLQFYGVMVNFMFQLDWVVDIWPNIPCMSGKCFWMRLSTLSLLSWVHLIQSSEDLNRT